MSKQALPWYRRFTCTYRGEEYSLMTLEMQAVYSNLLDYAGEQEPRGSFQTENLQVLAGRVAQGRLDLLKEVLKYCATRWHTESGDPHIGVNDGRGRFTNYEKFQKPRSEQPDAVANRQVAYKEGNNTLITDLNPLYNAQNDTLDKEVDREVERELTTTTARAYADAQYAAHNEDRDPVLHPFMVTEAPVESPEDVVFREIRDILEITGNAKAERTLQTALKENVLGDPVGAAQRWRAKCFEDRPILTARATSYALWLKNEQDTTAATIRTRSEHIQRQPDGVPDDPPPLTGHVLFDRIRCWLKWREENVMLRGLPFRHFIEAVEIVAETKDSIKLLCKDGPPGSEELYDIKVRQVLEHDMERENITVEWEWSA